MARSDRSRTDRLASPRFRAHVAFACAALLGLSLLISVGPTLGAANSANGGGKGTAGNVKVHDAATGLESSGGDNEPHVCDFWLGFTFDAPFEAGTWAVVSWAPTGDGSTVASGSYDTSGDGVDSSEVFELPAGHYRVEWAATGASSGKKKTFWVDADCGEPPADGLASPAEGLSATPDESPVEDASSLLEVSAQLVEVESTGQADESPAGEPATVDGSSAEEPATEEAGTDEGVAPSDGAPATATDGSVAEDPVEPDTSPVQDELGGLAANDEPTMPDTAMRRPSVPNGLLPVVVVLFLIAGQTTARRTRRAHHSGGES